MLKVLNPKNDPDQASWEDVHAKLDAKPSDVHVSRIIRHAQMLANVH